MKVEEIPWRDSPETRLRDYPIGTIFLFKIDHYVEGTLKIEGKIELYVLKDITVSSVEIASLSDSVIMVLKKRVSDNLFPRFCVITSKYGTGTAAE